MSVCFICVVITYKTVSNNVFQVNIFYTSELNQKNKVPRNVLFLRILLYWKLGFAIVTVFIFLTFLTRIRAVLFSFKNI